MLSRKGIISTYQYHVVMINTHFGVKIYHELFHIYYFSSDNYSYFHGRLLIHLLLKEGYNFIPNIVCIEHHTKVWRIFDDDKFVLNANHV